MRSFPGYTERTKREAGSQANKDESKRRQTVNKRHKALKSLEQQKKSRIANRPKR